jgi:hypothetical protein
VLQPANSTQLLYGCEAIIGEINLRNTQVQSLKHLINHHFLLGNCKVKNLPNLLQIKTLNLEQIWKVYGFCKILLFFSFQLDFHRCFSQADLKIRFLIELAVARRMYELAPDT